MTTERMSNVKGRARNGTTTFNLSGKCYVSYEWRLDATPLNYTHAADGQPYPIRQHGLGQLEIMPTDKCNHANTICSGKDGDGNYCAETWMLDHVIFFERTVGGRTLRDEIGFDVAVYEKQLNDAIEAGAPHVFLKPTPKS